MGDADPRELGVRETAIEAACAHLGAAVVQSCHSDDQIIMDHVKAAYEILKVVRAGDRKVVDLNTAEQRLARRGYE